MKKTKKYSYIVDLVDIETPADLLSRFADAKQKAGLPISDSEFNGLIERVTELASPTFCICECCVCTKAASKKKPWYKRLWNKLRGKKNK